MEWIRKYPPDTIQSRACLLLEERRIVDDDIRGELADNSSTGSTSTFDVEWGGQDRVGMESSDYSIFIAFSARLAT